MMRRGTDEKVFYGFIIGIVLVAAASMLLPFLNLVAISFSGVRPIINHEVFIWPKEFQTKTMEYVVTSPQMLSSLLNTIYITVVGTALSLSVTALMGYALSKKYIKVRFIVLLAVTFTMLFKPGIIPTYIVVRGVGLLDTRWALMIPVLINPFYLIIMKTFFQSLPQDVEESAIIDGAGTGTIFMRIVVPLSMNGLAVILLFYAVGRWNTFFHAVMYINDMSKYPLQVLLREIIVLGTSLDSSQGASEMVRNVPAENIKAATIVFATFPILVVYPFLQKYFVKGVMLGSIKG